MENFESINRSLFLSINGGADTPDWLVDVAVFIGDGLIYLVPLLLLYLWFWGDNARRNVAIKAFVVAMLAVGSNQVIALYWQHPRPFAIGLGHAWIAHVADSSFPSDHMTVLTGVGLALIGDGTMSLAAAILMGALVVSWARVFLGVHFPLDMAGAALVASMTWLIVSPFWWRFGASLTSFSETHYRKVFAWPISVGWVQK